MDPAMPVMETQGIPGSGLTVAAAGCSRFKVSSAQAIVESRPELIPHVVLVANHSSKPVVLFALAWRYSLSQGPESKYLRVYQHHLAPRSWEVVNSLGLAEPLPDRVRAQLLSLPKPQRVKVILDSVLFADGSYAGPDSAGALGDLLFQYRLYNGIIRAFEAGQSDSAVFLEAHAAATLSGGVRLHFRRRLAETLLREKEFQGVEAAVLLARRNLARLPHLHLTSGLFE